MEAVRGWVSIFSGIAHLLFFSCVEVDEEKYKDVRLVHYL